MANFYSAPDVYVENNDSPSVNSGVATGVAAFVGIAQRGPLNKATRIQSWNQFINKFALGMDSPFIASSDLAYAVYGFFQNGGSICDIVRVAHSTAAAAASTSSAGGEAVTAVFNAIDKGAWGNDLKITIAADDNFADGQHFVITVSLGTTVVETINGVCNTSTDANYWIYRLSTESSFISGVSGNVAATTTTITLSGGVDGVSDIVDSDFVDGLTALTAEDIAYVAISGQTAQTVLTGLTAFCTEDRKIVPVLEAPKTSTAAQAKALRKANENDTGCLVFPWGYVTDPLSKAAAPNNVRLCPPSGHFMGVMSRIAEKRGLWKSAAGTEATISGFVSLATALTKADIESLNPAGVVSIKAITNYGICVWGARSLNSTDSHFRYVSDLLLDAYIKRKCYALGLPYVFEPNKEDTWASIQTVISAFMNELFLKGAFKGATAKESYYVKCDADLNSEHKSKDDGIIETEIGYANVKPGEFIIFRFSHDVSNV